MPGRRYTILIADRSSGVVRRLSISLRPAITIVSVILAIPILMGLGARWNAQTEIGQLKEAKSVLEIENGSYRAATGELTTQIQSLEGVINDLGARSTVEPDQARAMQKLPAVIKAKAAGGASQPNPVVGQMLTSITFPEDTFGVLRELLQGLESRLRYVETNVERREALAASTPSIWPAHGWLTGTMGSRPDPFTGVGVYHQGIDISTDKGQPVYATADGHVESASYTGDYGNLIVLEHGFGLSTRYGHLSRFAVRAGQPVKRGDIIGYVGSTGRATGPH